jgi:hypothetical protein
MCIVVWIVEPNITLWQVIYLHDSGQKETTYMDEKIEFKGQKNE